MRNRRHHFKSSSNVLKMLLGTFEHYCNCDNQETRNASQESTHFSRVLVVTTVHIQVTSVLSEIIRIDRTFTFVSAKISFNVWLSFEFSNVKFAPHMTTFTICWIMRCFELAIVAAVVNILLLLLLNFFSFEETENKQKAFWLGEMGSLCGQSDHSHHSLEWFLQFLLLPGWYCWSLTHQFSWS